MYFGELQIGWLVSEVPLPLGGFYLLIESEGDGGDVQAGTHQHTTEPAAASRPGTETCCDREGSFRGAVSLSES